MPSHSPAHVRLVQTTIRHLDLEDISGAELARELDVASPPSWPPEYNGPETRAWIRDALVAHPHAAAWYASYVVAAIDDVPILAGTCGFKGPPDNAGVVEIGYSIIPELQRRGIGTAAIHLLCQRGFASGASGIVAETLPSLIASQRVLSKSGFRRVEVIRGGAGVDEIWRYRLDAP